MTYRHDAEARALHRTAVEQRLAEVRKQISELEPLRAEEAGLTRRIADLEREAATARAKAPLPILGQIRVASPCKESWTEMVGDDHVRHCGRCDKDVYDLSSLTREQAEALLRDRGAAMCVRFYRRADGTVLTADCPVGVSRKRIVRGLGLATATALAAAAAFVTFEETAIQGELAYDGPILGEAMLPSPVDDEVKPSEAPASDDAPMPAPPPPADDAPRPSDGEP